MKLNYLEALSRDEIEKIDYLSRKLLSEKGILIPCPEVKDLLQKRGVKFDGFIAKFDDKLISKAIEAVPHEINFI